MSGRMLITGSSGFIGASLAKAALDRGWDVWGVDLREVKRDSLAALVVDLGEQFLRAPVQSEDFALAFRRVKPDIVVHLAAEAIVEDSELKPMQTFETNVIGTVHVLELCRERTVPAIVASSDKSYGNGRIPFLETDPLRPVWPYDTSKACEDLIATSYFRTYSMPVIVTRGVNTYGPGDLNWTRLVPHTCRAALRRERPRNHRAMWTVKREWIYIDDLVAADLMLAKNLVDVGQDFATQLDGVVNIGTGQLASPSEIVPKVLRFLGCSDLLPILEDVPFHELQDEAVDSDRISHVGWRPVWELDTGLMRTIEWYRTYLEGRR